MSFMSTSDYVRSCILGIKSCDGHANTAQHAKSGEPARSDTATDCVTRQCFQEFCDQVSHMDYTITRDLKDIRQKEVDDFQHMNQSILAVRDTVNAICDRVDAITAKLDEIQQRLSDLEAARNSTVSSRARKALATRNSRKRPQEPVSEDQAGEEEAEMQQESQISDTTDDQQQATTSATEQAPESAV